MTTSLRTTNKKRSVKREARTCCSCSTRISTACDSFFPQMKKASNAPCDCFFPQCQNSRKRQLQMRITSDLLDSNKSNTGYSDDCTAETETCCSWSEAGSGFFSTGPFRVHGPSAPLPIQHRRSKSRTKKNSRKNRPHHERDVPDDEFTLWQREKHMSIEEEAVEEEKENRTPVVNNKDHLFVLLDEYELWKRQRPNFSFSNRGKGLHELKLPRTPMKP